MRVHLRSSAEGTSSVAGAESRRQEEKLVLQEECELVTIMEVVKGRLEVTTSHIYFFGNTPNREEGEHWKQDEFRITHQCLVNKHVCL